MTCLLHLFCQGCIPAIRRALARDTPQAAVVGAGQPKHPNGADRAATLRTCRVATPHQHDAVVGTLAAHMATTGILLQ